MAITRVAGQTPNGSGAGGVTSVNFTFAQNVVAGNVVIVGAVANGLTDDLTVSDNLGNTWVRDINISDSMLNAEKRSQIFHCNISTGGAMTVTLSVAGAARRLFIGGMEYTFSGGSALDKTASAIGNGSSASSGATATTAVADELLFGLNTDDFDGTPYTETSSFTQVFEVTTVFGGSGASDRIVSATGAYAATWTMSAANDWMAAIATYKEAGGGADVRNHIVPAYMRLAA